MPVSLRHVRAAGWLASGARWLTLAAACLTMGSAALAQGRASSAQAPAQKALPEIHLPSRLHGKAAADALGAQLPAVAAAYNKTAQQLRSQLLEDRSLWVDPRGQLTFVCEWGAVPSAPASGTVSALDAPFAYDQTFQLHSRPGSTKVIYLDFDGNVTSGTYWNSSFNGGADIVSAPFDLDGSPSTFSTTERDRIQYIWQRVAEDYAPFDVDVTTQDPGVEALRKTSSGDNYYGVRVVISPTNWYSTGAGGVAYLRSFTWNTDTPCWAFTQQLANGEKYIAEAASHEAGHTLGLSHDGVSGGDAYYSGHGSWAPIMGVGYYKEITQWSKGEYSGANNTEDDLAVMLNNGITYAADDHGDSFATATPLAGPNLSASGVIQRTADVDVFSFQTGAGTISLSVNPAPRSPNLDVLVELYNAQGTRIAWSDPSGLPAALSANVSAGTYYVRIDGVGTGDPNTGYTDYASLGQYTLTGTIVGGTVVQQPPVAQASANTTGGTAPVSVSFSSAGSSDPDGQIVSYSWNFGDGTSTSSSANPTHVYGSAGNYTATLTVTDNDGLTNSASVTITVTAPAANQAPVAVASASPTSGVAPLPVQFTGSGSYDPDGQIASNAWTFGDGGTSSQANPSHTYNNSGTYNATLTVTDNQGAQSSRSITITVSAAPQSLPDVFVGGIAMSLVPGAGGTAAQAVVTITDGSRVRAGATVTATWSGLGSGTVTGVTDASGKVVFTSKKSRKSGLFTLTINDVSISGYNYAPEKNAETSDSITN